LSTKKYVLALLEENRGKSVSGEHIAEQLNVSRNAVWKAIKELEKEGYKIKAVTNKGYCLEEENDILSVQGMLPFLLRKDNARQIIIYDSLESTNKTAKEMAAIKI
jgi:BirA family biotin operon repressor/biotin-[acetyl-CoA-carboxylase] ligase